MENPEIVQSELVNIRTLFKYDTEFCADSVEWCPQEPFHNYFVCANYQLCEGNEGTYSYFFCLSTYLFVSCIITIGSSPVTGVIHILTIHLYLVAYFLILVKENV